MQAKHSQSQKVTRVSKPSVFNDPCFVREREFLDGTYQDFKEKFNRYNYLVSRGGVDITKLFYSVTGLMQMMGQLQERYALSEEEQVANYFSLLKIKLSLLYGCIALELPSPSEMLSLFSPVMRALDKSIKTLHYENDYLFKIALDEFIDKLRCSTQKKITAKIISHESYFEFSKKCGPSFILLKASYEGLTHEVLSNYKNNKKSKQIVDLYKECYQEIKTAFERSATLQTLFDFLNANLLTFEFEVKTNVHMRKSTVHKAVETNNLDYLNHYVSLFSQLKQDYLIPTIELLQKYCKYKKMQEKSLFLDQYAKIYAKIYELLASTFYLFLIINDSYGEAFGNSYKNSLLKEIDFLYETICSFNFINNEPIDTLLRLPLDFENNSFVHVQGYDSLAFLTIQRVYALFAQEMSEGRERYESELESKALIAAKYQEYLLLEEAQKASQKSKPKAMVLKDAKINLRAPQESSKEQSVVGESPMQFSRFDEYMNHGFALLRHKKYYEALNQYSKAKNEALSQQDNYLHLSAIDALTVVYASLFEQKMDLISVLLTSRLASPKPLSNDKLDQLDFALDEVRALDETLDELSQEFMLLRDRVLVDEQDQLVRENIANGQRMMFSQRKNIKLKIHNLEQKKNELNVKKLQEREQFIMQLGRQELEPGQSHSLQEIKQQGQKKFAELGNNKKEKGESLSNFTREFEMVSKVESVLGELTKAYPNQGTLLSASVTLDSLVCEGFCLLNQVSQAHFLVGSQVINLLLSNWNQPLIPTNDLDFVSANVAVNDLEFFGFVPTQRNDLFACFQLSKKIELVRLTHRPNWLMDSLLSRHFTVAALCCDSEGLVIDPTGMGFSDLKNRCLRMIGDPLKRLQQDPIIALLVIKYEMLGFTPNPELVEALFEFKPSQSLPRAHLNAVLTKLLRQFDEKQCVQKLIHYQLVGLLFGIDYQGDLEQTLVVLTNKIKETMPSQFTGAFFPIAHKTKEENESLLLTINDNKKPGQ